jgi:hypothetical protein
MDIQKIKSRCKPFAGTQGALGERKERSSTKNELTFVYFVVGFQRIKLSGRSVI